mgnify:CR=1 FL=1
MRKRLVVLIDLEDTTPDLKDWFSDTIALEHTIHERLEEADGVTVHDIKVVIDLNLETKEDDPYANVSGYFQ